MVANITSLTGNGLKDWLIQRVSAIYLALYIAFILGYMLMQSTLEYNQWHAFFHCTWVQVASVIALLLLLLHAWIGLWTVTTDYVKCTVIRVSVQVLIALYLVGQFLWGCMIVWGQ